MPSTIILYNQLGDGASTSGTWSRVSPSGPPAPSAYNSSIDFSGYAVDDYVYRYTIGDSTADVTVDWQGVAPARVNGTCDTAMYLTGVEYPPFVITVSDTTMNTCGPKGQQEPSDSESPVPTTWNQGTYVGDLWYSFLFTAQPSLYTLMFEVSGEAYGSSGVYGPAIAVYTSAPEDDCASKVQAAQLAANGGNQEVRVPVIISAETDKLVRVRVSSLNEDSRGSFNLTVSAIGTGVNNTSGGAAPAGSRIVQYVHDSGGTGILYWTSNSGNLPSNLSSGFEVYSNGQRLEYLSQYTVTANSGPGQSTITITYPVPDQYYTLIAYF